MTERRDLRGRLSWTALTELRRRPDGMRTEALLARLFDVVDDEIPREQLWQICAELGNVLGEMGIVEEAASRVMLSPDGREMLTSATGPEDVMRAIEERIGARARASTPERPSPLDAAATREMERLIGRIRMSGAGFTDLLARLGPTNFEKKRTTVGTHLATVIRTALDEGRPASFIRLGEGEGALLGKRIARHEPLREHCIENIVTFHFGKCTSAAIDEILDGMLDAAAEATYLGVHDPRVVLARAGTDPRKVRAVYGAACAVDALMELSEKRDLSRARWVPPTFHRALAPHLSDLVRGRHVVLVCCYPNLKDELLALGAASVTFHHVPRRARGRALDGPPHVPDRYHDLMAQLPRARAGSFGLVAAGPPAKAYCAALARAGCIAVDIGAVADAWAGVGLSNKWVAATRRALLGQTGDGA